MSAHGLTVLFRQETKPDWRTVEGGSQELPLDFLVSNLTYKMVNLCDLAYQYARRIYLRLAQDLSSR